MIATNQREHDIAKQKHAVRRAVMSVYNMNSVDDNYDFFDFLDYTVTKVDGDFIFAPPTDYNS